MAKNDAKHPGSNGETRSLPKLALTYEEAAWSLGVSEETLRRGVSEGRLPHVKVGARTLFPVDRLREWLKEHEALRNAG